ncbi:MULTISPECIES: SLATT domain-containing protein [Streptomyces]|uniref:SLATT domain-containing protein n=1 Tax=Streptomyces TaxID=1883 RepID=UPI001F1C898C|nr:SLATT domain-containing protein [Streptomyces lycii]
MERDEETGARRRGRGRGDLRGRPFPVLPGGPGGQREAVRLLRAWAEQEAEDAIDWYLRDKRLKRIGAKTVRALVVLLTVAGAVLPLSSAVAGRSPGGWGYVLLGLAAGCKGFDLVFGLSTGWMRDIRAAQALRGELNDVRLAWAADTLRAGGRDGAGTDGGPLSASELERQLELIGRLVTAVRERIGTETDDWLTEFRSTTQQLHEPGGPVGPAVPQ